VNIKHIPPAVPIASSLPSETLITTKRQIKAIHRCTGKGNNILLARKELKNTYWWFHNVKIERFIPMAMASPMYIPLYPKPADVTLPRMEPKAARIQISISRLCFVKILV
jgi:hypothetical protein